METLDANFEVLQEILNFYIEVFIIRESQFASPDLKNLNLNFSMQPNSIFNGEQTIDFCVK
jgi:hypothetical protein